MNPPKWLAFASCGPLCVKPGAWRTSTRWYNAATAHETIFLMIRSERYMVLPDDAEPYRTPLWSGPCDFHLKKATAE